jgi:hypothetical protein
VELYKLIEQLTKLEEKHGPDTEVVMQGDRTCTKFELVMCTHRYSDGSVTDNNPPDPHDPDPPVLLDRPVLSITEA